MLRYRVVNLGQAVVPPPAPKPACPEIATSAGLNCQKTPEGGVLCSDKTYYPPGCASPPITTPGVTTYVREDNQIKLATPPPFDLGQDTGKSFPWLLVAIPVAGLVITALW